MAPENHLDAPKLSEVNKSHFPIPANPHAVERASRATSAPARASDGPGTLHSSSGQCSAAPVGQLRGEVCPFHDGLATLDLLLAQLDPRELELFDAALDLRSLCAQGGGDAAECLEQLFRVRTLLGERHYLAFYRVRCWARRSLRVEVRAGRDALWMTKELPLDCARLDEIINTASAALVGQGGFAPTAQVRFVFAGSG